MSSRTDRSHPIRRGGRTLTIVAIVGLLAGFSPAAVGEAADENPERFTKVTGERTAPVTPFVIDVDVRDLPAPKEWRPGDPVHEVPRRMYLPPGVALPIPEESRDPLVDRQLGFAQARRSADAFTVPTHNFPGIDYTGSGVPDTVGDVGPDHIIQSTNAPGGSRVQIWDKAIPTPTQVASFMMDSLGTGQCAFGFGDPIVIHDRNAGRWVLMEFSSSGNSLCVYVSQTGDPVTGGWYAYSFVPPSFPDYPKLGVWPTDSNGGAGSYVVTANAGVAVYAMERAPMLTGDPAGFQIFDLPSLPGFGFQTTTPADIDGPDIPPTGAPAIVMRHRDTEVHNGPIAPGDLLEMWAFDVDWVTTANSTISSLPSIDVAEFSSDLCGLTSFSCIEQPGTPTRLDPLREVIMNRLQYINHGSEFETVVGNFIVDASGTDQGAIRWFEVRRTEGISGSWSLHQEGTYSIDSDNRWMGGSSMDLSGNIALAYNVSSSATYPGLRYTGRVSDDPLGVMTAAETSIVAGTDHSGTNRYGDYAAMGLDPADDCTFWFTGEYNTSTVWSSRWVSFKFDQCGCPRAPTSPSLVATTDELNRVDLTWDDSDLDTVIEYSVRRSRIEGGPYETIATIEDTSPGIAEGPGYGFTDFDVSGGIPYYYVVVATDGGQCKSDQVNEVSVVPDGFCLLRPLFGGVVSAQVDIDDTCGNLLTWSPAVPECGTHVLYNVYRSTDAGFVPGPANLVASGISGTSALDRNDLVATNEYHYVVRALDTASLTEDLNSVKVSVVAGGADGQETLYFEDFEDVATFDDWTVTTGPNLHRCGEWAPSSDGDRRPAAGSGQFAMANSYDCQAFLPATSSTLYSPTIDLSDPSFAAAVLEFDMWFNVDSGGESGSIEVWDGAQWVVLWADSAVDVDTTMSFDVGPYALGNPNFQIRFDYQSGNADRWFSIDNVRVGVDLACDTAPSPSPAPNGTAGSSPMTGVRASVAGDAIDVAWDAATCGSGVFNMLYGNLANVASHSLSGSECSIGSSGSFSWAGVPADDLFFLVVGGDGVSSESSWGHSTYGERNGLTPSGECAVTAKSVASTCP